MKKYPMMILGFFSILFGVMVIVENVCLREHKFMKMCAGKAMACCKKLRGAAEEAAEQAPDQVEKHACLMKRKLKCLYKLAKKFKKLLPI